MAKIFPYTPNSSSSSTSLERETFTIWMKSLVLNGNGCTVFNSSGKIVYRIDNYDTKCSNEVYLMDLKGNVVCTILKKKLLLGHWNGYNCNGSKEKNEKPWFQVRKKLLQRDCPLQVIMGCDKGICYRIEGNAHKSEFKIIDGEQRIVAEVKRKQSSTGVVLGDDVLSLMVEPHVDYSLIMSLVAVYGLIGHKM